MKVQYIESLNFTKINQTNKKCNLSLYVKEKFFMIFHAIQLSKMLGESMASISFSHSDTHINSLKVLSFNQLLQSSPCTPLYFENPHSQI